jgi:thiol-disulfide isomerase/thioredoxin
MDYRKNQDVVIIKKNVMRTILTTLLIIPILFSCNPKKKKETATPYPLASQYLKKIKESKARGLDLYQQMTKNPQTEAEKQTNDSLLSLQAIAIDNYIKHLTESYGKVPTDSILKEISGYRGYIPPAIVAKLQPEDWQTEIGQKAKKQYDQFMSYYKKFERFNGVSLANSKIELKSTEGEISYLGEAIAKGTYLVDVWASWCSACRRFNRTHKQDYSFLKEKGIETVAISIDKNEDNFIRAAKSDHVPWTDLNDHTGEFSKFIGNVPLPFQFIVKDGTIVKILHAGGTKEQLLQYLKSK